MAEFKAGDRVVKMSGIGAGKYGTVNSVMENGTLNVTFDGERLPKWCDPARCGQVAANAKFKVGDRVKSAKYPELGEMKVERVFQDIHGTAYRTSRDGFLTDDIHYDRTLIPANAVRNANSRACNAEITPELRKAYDEWKKAEAKFAKWWNPDRRLSERPPKGADSAKKGLDFSAVFKRVMGKLPPNRYGSMSLEQMVDAVSKNAARNEKAKEWAEAARAQGDA